MDSVGQEVLEGQGYSLSRNLFYQDNASAMKMESNGRKLASDKSRHINIRYFFIKDVFEREDIELVHCPIERMIADYYTKSLHGSLFRKLRAKRHINGPHSLMRRVLDLMKR